MPVINCPLFEESYYSYSIDLEDDAFVLTFRYNERAEQWIMSIADAEENVLVRNIALVPMYPLINQYALSSLSGEFILIPIEGVGISSSYIQNPRQIYQSYLLIYNY